jgi:hypothetical protein
VKQLQTVSSLISAMEMSFLPLGSTASMSITAVVKLEDDDMQGTPNVAYEPTPVLVTKPTKVSRKAKAKALHKALPAVPEKVATEALVVEQENPLVITATMAKRPQKRRQKPSRMSFGSGGGGGAASGVVRALSPVKIKLKKKNRAKETETPTENVKKVAKCSCHREICKCCGLVPHVYHCLLCHLNGMQDARENAFLLQHESVHNWVIAISRLMLESSLLLLHAPFRWCTLRHCIKNGCKDVEKYNKAALKVAIQRMIRNLANGKFVRARLSTPKCNRYFITKWLPLDCHHPLPFYSCIPPPPCTQRSTWEGARTAACSGGLFAVGWSGLHTKLQYF